VKYKLSTDENVSAPTLKYYEKRIRGGFYTKKPQRTTGNEDLTFDKRPERSALAHAPIHMSYPPPSQ